MYYGLFEKREDICKEFNISSFDGVVLHAQYEYEEYDGHAIVIFAHDGKFYYTEGAHCSCYGLEGQWEPEEMTAEALTHMLRKGRALSEGHKLANGIEHLSNLLTERAPEHEIQMWVKLLF